MTAGPNRGIPRRGRPTARPDPLREPMTCGSASPYPPARRSATLKSGDRLVGGEQATS
jgi:hypothetical protein